MERGEWFVCVLPSGPYVYITIRVVGGETQTPAIPHTISRDKRQENDDDHHHNHHQLPNIWNQEDEKKKKGNNNLKESSSSTSKLSLGFFLVIWADQPLQIHMFSSSSFLCWWWTGEKGRHKRRLCFYCIRCRRLLKTDSIESSAWWDAPPPPLLLLTVAIPTAPTDGLFPPSLHYIIYNLFFDVFLCGWSWSSSKLIENDSAAEDAHPDGASSDRIFAFFFYRFQREMEELGRRRHDGTNW